MTKETAIKLFEHREIRAEWDETTQRWYFAIVDVIAVLTASADPGAYWRKLKERLKRGGNETVTNCHGLKMTAADGKQRMTDVADTEQLLRGERVTTEMSQVEKPETFAKNRNVARRGGNVAGMARRETEKELGRNVVSSENFCRSNANGMKSRSKKREQVP